MTGDEVQRRKEIINYQYFLKSVFYNSHVLEVHLLIDTSDQFQVEPENKIFKCN